MSDPTDMLDQLDEARAKGTRGSWRALPDDHAVDVTTYDGFFVALDAKLADAALIVAAVNALPQLTAALRAVLDKCDRMEAEAPKPQVGGFMAEEFRRVVVAALTPGADTAGATA